jgi:Xaa-Pro aminopeptidase
VSETRLVKVIDEVISVEGLTIVVIVGVAVLDFTFVCIEVADPVTITVRVCKEETEIVATEEAVGQSDAEFEAVTEGLDVGVAAVVDETLTLAVRDVLFESFDDDE